MKYQNSREEELKNKVAQDYFWLYDCTQIIGNVDFCVAMHSSQESEINSLVWAEAKKGSSDIYKSIVQLVLTIGKARTFDKFLPPAFLAAFDAEKIAFVPYSSIHDIFYINDFNWNVAPSNHETKEFKLVYENVKNTIDTQTLLFYFIKDDKEIRQFVKENLVVGKFGVSKIKIDKNNFVSIFNKWLSEVKPSIVMNWEIAKKRNIIEADFYLADLISEDNVTLKEQLFVRLDKDMYELDKRLNDMGMFDIIYTKFNDKQVAHTQFWNKYERPPKDEYCTYILERRDLLVPQDIRERKGSFFTPQIWVELSQKYLADVLGEDWQDEYYLWDCAAGTGNLLAGLTNKYHIYASTLDKQDVDVMHDRIKNGANLLEDHVFQFDFLNDDFSKLPRSLKNIIDDPEKRKKLVIYINPPYAEATDGIGKGGRKIDVSKETAMYKKYGDILKKAKNELFAQFFMRIYKEIDGCIIAEFSTLKHLNSPNFSDFRKNFLAKLIGMFIVPANTFDNVVGKFPIGFMIWNTHKKEAFSNNVAAVYSEKGELIQQKNIFVYNGKGYLNNWIKQYSNNVNGTPMGYLAYLGNDFQHANEVRITSFKPTSHISILELNKNILIVCCVYFAVRHCIKATWLNDRDQFLYPADEWENDTEFHNDCLAFTIFHSQNKISSSEGINHWIPFSEAEVNARTQFDSNFMHQFIKGKIKPNGNGKAAIFDKVEEPKANYNVPLQFSAEAKFVFEAGKELWKYYHKQPNANVNVSLYDIKVHFQGRNEQGKMNSKGNDEMYNQHINNLREALKTLAEKIEPRIYQYGFLKL